MGKPSIHAIIVCILSLGLLIGFIGVGQSVSLPESPNRIEHNLSTPVKGDSNSSTDSQSPGSTETPVIDITYTINRTPSDRGNLTVIATVSPPDNLINFTFYTSTVTVTNASGFDRVSNEAWQWEANSTIDTPSLTYRLPSNATGQFGQTAAETGSWAFTGGRFRLPYYYYYYFIEPSVLIDVNIARTGHAGTYWAFLGNHSVYAQNSSTQKFRYVLPAAAKPRLATDRVLNYLRNLSRAIEIGERDQSITVFVAPSPPIRGGGAAIDAEFWVSDHLFLTTIAHEYTHTRQVDWNLSTQMAWLVEGHGEYRGYYYAWQLESYTTEDFRYLLQSGSGFDRPLAEAGSTSSTAYDKGALTLAKVDLLIRNHSEGAYSLTDVFTAVNRFNHTTRKLTYPRFKGILTRTTGISINSSLDRFVLGTEKPNLPTNLSEAYTIEALFNVSNLETRSTVTAGESISINVSVTNNGQIAGTQTIEFLLGDSVVSRKNISLDAGTTKNITANISTDSLAQGTVLISVSPENGDGARTELTVNHAAIFSIAQVKIPNSIVRGENVTVQTTIQNLGSKSGSQVIKFWFNDSLIETRTVSLGTGDNTSLDFTFQTNETELGMYPIRISTKNDTWTRKITIKETLFSNVIPGSSGTGKPRDPDDDDLYEDVNGDGVITFSDAIALAFVQNDQLTQAQINALDFDGDGDLDFEDAFELAFQV